jgi:hypothetical protein
MSTARYGQLMYMKSQKEVILLISSKFGRQELGSKNATIVGKAEPAFSVHPQDHVVKWLIISLVHTETRKCLLHQEV